MNQKTGKKKQSEKRARFYSVIGLGFFGLFICLKVALNVSIDHTNREKSKLLDRLKNLSDQNAELVSQVEKLKEPDRIKKIAREELNFVPVRKINLELYPDGE
ncbi:septum formation initiator family protein [candidate division KSB1 bacterium]|nr:septum formation initiator family protein [candidate division KSB1 bacterium]